MGKLHTGKVTSFALNISDYPSACGGTTPSPPGGKHPYYSNSINKKFGNICTTKTWYSEKNIFEIDCFIESQAIWRFGTHGSWYQVRNDPSKMVSQSMTDQIHV